MKILFVNLSPLAIDVGMPDRAPLGGTESSACYLARHLAANGHQVTLAANLPDGTPETVMGVRHVVPDILDEAGFWQEGDFGAAIGVANPIIAPFVKVRSPRTFTVAWEHKYPDPDVKAALAQSASGVDCALFVGKAQQAAYGYAGASQVIGNGFAPAFENMFASAAELIAAKQNRAVYTSMPFRGLDVLVAAMEQSRAATELEIYSAMRVYGLEEGTFQKLYDWAARNPKTQYRGAVSQHELAQRLKGCAFLTYPCTFRETYCIAAVEAMAAGLKVIATDLGPLPDTTMGFADLLHLRPGMQLGEIAAEFARLLEKNETAFLAAPQAWAEERFAQMQAVNQKCSWKARAAEWEAFLEPAIAARRS